MMYTLIVENEKKEQLRLTQNIDYQIKDIDGLTPPTAILNFSEVATNDGSIFNSSRIQRRVLTISICPRCNVEANRITLYKFFQVKKWVKLYFSNGSRDVSIEGYVESFDGSLFEMTQTLSISVICPNPYFQDAYGSTAVIAQITPLFEFPFSTEIDGIEFSTIDKQLSKNLVNEGDSETGVIIELLAIGEVVNPKVFNTETRKSFGLNFEMQLGDIIRINTNKNNKYVELERNAETTNIINYVMPNPEWFQLEIGDNIFTYSCDSGEENLELRFYHTNLYTGV